MILGALPDCQTIKNKASIKILVWGKDFENQITWIVSAYLSKFINHLYILLKRGKQISWSVSPICLLFISVYAFNKLNIRDVLSGHKMLKNVVQNNSLYRTIVWI